MISKPGQINRGSTLGEMIYNLCLQEDINRIVEIGSWNGLGSTKCIYDAVSIKNSNYTVHSLECNHQFYNICLINYKNLPKLENFHFVYGTIISPDDNLNPSTNFDDKSFTQFSREVQTGWYMEDFENCKIAPNVLNLIPTEIDLLILDGGEFCGLAEFNKLKNRSKYFVLDDTLTIKNNEVANIMRSDPEYRVLIDSNERNGFLVSKKIS
jgi:hypothetical protein